MNGIWSIVTPEMFTEKMLAMSKQELTLDDYKKEFFNYWVTHKDTTQHVHHDELDHTTKALRLSSGELQIKPVPVGVPCRLHGKTTLHRQMVENKVGWDDYSTDELNNSNIVPTKYKPN
ncbi:hypothetical protein TSMG0087 [Halocynthia phage JM-2012]|uniref:hypothetical protein n=1 Tax=Halocynthia phage JM-2012 TaxID=1173297 RepID=UPI00025C692B|nr:hypothetical protein TSMG0087 [Halocynthia phage JM-2012]AFI55370.1 hypothetical protein TSMG0087 [Halocynthia phage JM-2012]